MTKLFEIPVYAVNRKSLKVRTQELCKKIKNEHSNNSETHICDLADLMTYPYRLWDYNHIVGYIKISTNGRNILFDIFLPTPHKDRYHWRSGQKIFLYDISANGTHFYVNERMSNEDIQARTAEMLQSVIKTHIPKRYCADTEAFDFLNNKLDYIRVMEEAQNGQTEI